MKGLHYEAPSLFLACDQFVPTEFSTSDYPSMPYERILRDWRELGYSDALMEKIFHQNAERILGL